MTISKPLSFRFPFNLPLKLIWIAAILSVLLPMTGCKKDDKTPPRATPEVSAIQIEPRDTPVSFEFVAQTQSSHSVEIRARVNGFLNRRVYTEGTIVKAGQVLFEMDPKPFQAQLDQSKAALAQQEAALKVAQANLARVKPLTSLNALSQRDLDDATGNAHSTAAAVEQAKAQVETSRLNLSYCTISSPIDGITGAAMQQDGAYISTGNNQLTTVMALSPIWVNFSLSENEMQNYRNQMAKGLLKPPANNSYEVEIILVDGTVFPHTGRITFADPMYSSQTGTFLIRSSVQNPKGILRPNQYVRVRVKGNVRPAAILIPQQAVQSGAKGHFVWIVSPDGTVRPRPVEVGDWYGNNWFINDGLKAGETVVVEGGLALQPDAKVRTKPVTVGSPAHSGDGKPVADTSRSNAPAARN
ncbi:membrane fusion protein, multidrug efflux system [Syntrophus gentianae]|uniref:Membrane fusion protein, multidrug efflux system n=1 Tax=Syntrophus gentianae TaxID=43775 RepID=A0A1H7WPC6_9BACT|nr:efflux RND transporter periplasmic adaptor subunit [Syntrophus gentianae]SEM22899.1 membrane fusion protein, multidrug efflux system [Syntrophus gentianae]